MTDIDNSVPAAVADAPTFGARLAAERERQGLSVREIAARLRLHPRQIEAIEREEFDRLPGGPFVRGFIRNYAKELKVDPEPLLAHLGRRQLLPAEESGAVPPMVASASPSPSSPMARAVLRERLSRPLVLFVALAALLALAIIGSFGPRLQDRTDTVAPVAPPVAKTQSAPAGETPVPPVAPVADSAAPAPAPAPAPTAEPGILPAVAPQAAPPRSGALRLLFTGESWVEVTQADGRVLLSQLNAAGSEQRLDGNPPLKLVIGNAGAVTLEYRGKRIDLTPRTSVDNVARVTLD